MYIKTVNLSVSHCSEHVYTQASFISTVEQVEQTLTRLEIAIRMVECMPRYMVSSEPISKGLPP